MSTTAAHSVPTGTYNIDAAHSNVGFEVKHMGVSTVRGAFTTFAGTVEAGDSLTISGTVDVSSVSTGQEQRDGHLLSGDFFEVEKFPEISFTSTHVESHGEQIKLAGEITIKGITKPIELEGEFAAAGDRIGFEVSGKVDRREFELKFNQPLDTGGFALGHNVKLVISASAVKAA